MNNNMIAEPFFVWIGGKRRLINQYQNLYPRELKNGTIKRYIECFLGSGAMFLDIQQKYKIEETILIDINPSLICTFLELKYNVDDFIIELLKLQEKYNKLDFRKKEKMYYDVRYLFNYNQKFDVNKAVQFVFLSKAVFNGCIRYNQKGRFNSPFGFKEKLNLCNNKNLLKINKILENATIKCGDYTECKEYINSCTFIYFDPPYRPTEKSGIIKYDKKIFNEDNQRELKSFCDYTSDKGAYTMISNSYSEDGFFQKLYDGYNLNVVDKYSYVASNNKYRKPIKEFVITNY